MGQIDQAAMSRMSRALAKLQEATGKADLQAQTVQTFLYVTYRHPNQVPMREVEQFLGLSQSASNRNTHYLAEGAMGMGGYGLVKVEEDPYYRKRKLITLTTTGEKLASEMSDCINGVSNDKGKGR